MFLLTLVLVVLGVSGQSAQTRSIWPRLSCEKGELKLDLGVNFVCLPCPDGSFNDVDNHLNPSCKLCKNYSRETDFVEEWEPCTRDRDAIVIRCMDTLKMFIEYDPYKKRYYCTPCREDDCRHRLECCDKTGTTTASTPATTAGSLRIFSLGLPSNKQNLTKCDDIASEGCIGKELMNKTCLFSIGLIEQSLLCQNCPQYNNMTVCSDTPKETVYHQKVISGLSTSEIITIAIFTLILVAMFVAGMCFCHRRANSQTYRTYEMARRETTSSNKKNEQESTTTV